MHELVDMLLTIVSERRINAGQQAEAHKRSINDATSPQMRSQYGLLYDIAIEREKQYQSLLGEMEAVVCEELGDNWRSSL